MTTETKPIASVRIEETGGTMFYAEGSDESVSARLAAWLEFNETERLRRHELHLLELDRYNDQHKGLFRSILDAAVLMVTPPLRTWLSSVIEYTRPDRSESTTPTAQ